MQSINFNLFYPNPLINRILQTNPNLDSDSFDIDYSNENPNSIILQSDTLSIGSFLDALIYCLALNDIDPLCYSITENNEHNSFTITFSLYH